LRSIEGWGGRTITEPFPDGQNDNDCNRDQLAGSRTNCEVITKFKTEEHQKVEGEEGHHTNLRVVALIERGVEAGNMAPDN